MGIKLTFCYELQKHTLQITPKCNMFFLIYHGWCHHGFGAFLVNLPPHMCWSWTARSSHSRQQPRVLKLYTSIIAHIFVCLLQIIYVIIWFLIRSKLSRRSVNLIFLFFRPFGCKLVLNTEFSGSFRIWPWAYYCSKGLDGVQTCISH